MGRDEFVDGEKSTRTKKKIIALVEGIVDEQVKILSS